jgi:hypothetical protein
MRQPALIGRFFLVTGLLGGLAALAYQGAPQAGPQARLLEPKPAAAQVVPAYLVDRGPRPAAVVPRSFVVDRDPPDHCFEPRSRANAMRGVACG